MGTDVIGALAQLAARICEARAAGIVARAGEPRCWVSPPFELAHLPRCIAMASALAPDEMCIISDVDADGRLSKELAAGPPSIKFFAALPLLGADAQTIGTLIIADDRPRDVSADHRLALRLVAKVASAYVEHGMDDDGRELPSWLVDLVDNAPVGLHALDGTGTVQWMNQTELRWLGYAREEVIGKMQIGQLVPADRLDDLRRSLTEVMSSGRAALPDAVLERRDRRPLPVYLVANDARGPDGAVIRIRTAVVDRSELRPRPGADVFEQSDVARQLSQLRRCLDAGTAAAWHVDLSTGQFRGDGALAAMLGLSPTAGPSMDYMRTVVHPDDTAEAEVAFDRARRDRTEYRHSHRVRTIDGAYRWIAINGRFRYDSESNPVGLSGVMMEIDDPVHGAGRAASARQIADILEGISDGFVALDRDWKYTYVNRHAGKMFGRRPAELIGRHIWTEFPEGRGQPFHLAYERARRDQVAVHFEDYYAPWDRWYENRVYPTPDGGLIIFFSDITERHRRDQEQHQTGHRLRQLSERLMAVREEEAARLAREVHDGLGQTLTALKLDLGWIGRQLDNGVGDLGGVTAKLREATALVDELFAAIRRMAAELRPRMLEDLGLAATIEWYVRGVAARSGLEHTLDLDASDLPIPRATATALYRVLQECLTNVVRHAMARRITVRLARSGDDVVMTVLDDGKGVTAGEAADSPGLGLVGARERMSLIGGHFEIAAAPGGGTIATARAPLVPVTS